MVTAFGLAELYIERWAKPRKKSWKEDQRILMKDVVPEIGAINASEVTRAQIAAMLNKIAFSTKPKVSK